MARRLLTLWLILNALAFIFAGQTWWQVQINTGDQIASLSGTGFDADRSISAILMFSLAALLFVAFSRNWVSAAISGLASLAVAALTVATASHFFSQNIGDISSSVEKRTGIAINPILAENLGNQISGELLFWGWLTIVTMFALVVVQLVIALKIRGWSKAAKPKTDRINPKLKAAEVDDAISLWDNQRN